MARPRKLNRDLPPRVTRRNGAIYYIREVYKDGKQRQKWVRLGKEWGEETKKRWLALSEEDKTSKKESVGAMAVLIDRYMQEIAPTKAPKTYQENVKQAVPLRAFFGPMDPAEVKPKHVYAYLDVRGKKTPTAANREKALLSHIFRYAIRWGVVDVNPCRDVEALKVAKRDRYITDEEFLAVRGKANETVALVMDFAYLTAQRIGDILALKLDSINDEGITIEQSKTKKKLVIVWTDSLRALVDEIHALDRPQGEHLFRNRRGKGYTYFGFSAMFRKTAVRAGVKDFHFHDIRAKALTDHKRKGGDAQLLAGHASSRMTDHYIKRLGIERVSPVDEMSGSKEG